MYSANGDVVSRQISVRLHGTLASGFRRRTISVIYCCHGRLERCATEETHMAEPPPYPGAPRWVKVFGLIAIILVLLLAVLMFTRGPGGRGHGPQLHTPSSGR